MNLIAAIDSNRCIGKDNELLFRIKADLKHFKSLTENKVVVMGRKTWDSLPKAPLPNRINVILTRDKNFTYNEKGVLVYHSFEEMEKCLLTFFDTKDIFIIGGESIYKHYMNKCDKFYITQIYDSSKEGNKFLPEIPFNEDKWEISIGEMQQENGIRFSFGEYTKISKMIYTVVTKEAFCSIIEKIQKEYERKNKLADAFYEFDKESYFYPVGLESDLIEFLEELTEDKDGWISYFIHELDFGKKYEDGTIKVDGENYELKNSEQLYNLLRKNMNY